LDIDALLLEIAARDADRHAGKPDLLREADLDVVLRPRRGGIAQRREHSHGGDERHGNLLHWSSHFLSTSASGRGLNCPDGCSAARGLGQMNKASALSVLYDPAMAENSTDQRKPRFMLPANATDCQFHVSDNDPRFPAHQMDTALAVHRRLGIGRGILVQALPESRAISLQGLALAGSNYRAITPILEVPSEKELAGLHEAGFRGVRFSLTRARPAAPPDLA